MVSENERGAPRIHAELLKLGHDVSERTVSRSMPKKPVDPDIVKRWLAFLRNHRDAIAGMDFFTVPTASFGILYVFFIIHHARRQILHFAVTAQPTADWVRQQLREAFPFDALVPRHMIFDRDPIFNKAVVTTLEGIGAKSSRTAYRCPWQNPIAERWIGSVRRELLDHVVVLNKRQLHRLLRSYVAYYHEDRCHLSLDKDPPVMRPVTPKPSPDAKVIALPRVGGLHHRYEWRDAA